MSSLPEPTSQPVSAPRLPLVVILGPTGVGKTEVAIQVARQVRGEIISADSRYFYRGLDIGTAKPTLTEMQGVPHYLIDVANPSETWSLAEFQAAAVAAINAIHARGNLPLLVGGTGQYIRAVAQGWQAPAQPANPALRAALERWAASIGNLGLYAHLRRLDPVAAATIDPRNLRRTVRALEVIFSTGQRFSSQRLRAPSPYRLLQLGLARPRAELYERIDSRITAMLAAGWVDEVRRLLAQGYSEALPSMSAIGYAQLIRHVRNELSLDDAVTEIKRLTRQFVRRQANWFKPSDPEIHWVIVDSGAIQACINEISRFLIGID